MTLGSTLGVEDSRIAADIERQAVEAAANSIIDYNIGESDDNSSNSDY